MVEHDDGMAVKDSFHFPSNSIKTLPVPGNVLIELDGNYP